MHAALLIFWVAWGLIAYTYVFFPLVLAAIARIKKPLRDQPPIGQPNSLAAGQSECLPRVAMVVAAFNEEAVMARKLANTWAIDYPADRFQLYVGSDGSTDCTADILRACDDRRLRSFTFPQRRGKISVLNDLLDRVDADIVVMSDANTMYAPDAVCKLVRHFSDPRIGCVSGELRLENAGGVSGEGIYWRYEQWIKRNESRLGFLIGSNGAVFAIRRHLFDALPSNTIIEDFVLTMRVVEKGYRVRFEPAAHVTEPPCASSRAEMVRKIRIGAGGFQALGLTRQLLKPRYGLCAFAYWGHKVLRWLVPQCLLTALAANLVIVTLAYRGTALAYDCILGLQLLGAGMAAAAYRPVVGRKLPRVTRPVSYFYLMNYALLLGFIRFLSGRQRVTWERAAAPVVPAYEPAAEVASFAGLTRGGLAEAPQAAVVRVAMEHHAGRAVEAAPSRVSGQ